MSDGPALTLYKADSDPSWRDTAARYAAPWGLVDEVLDDYDKAIADCTELIRFNPKLASGYNGRGWIKYLTGDYDGAITDATQAIQLNPKFKDSYGTRGWARYRKGDPAGAVEDCKKAIELSKPDSVEANEDQGLLDFINGSYVNAVANWKKVVQKDIQTKRHLQSWIEKAEGLENQ